MAWRLAASRPRGVPGFIDMMLKSDCPSRVTTLAALTAFAMLLGGCRGNLSLPKWPGSSSSSTPSASAPASSPSSGAASAAPAAPAVVPARSEAEVKQLLDNARNLLDQGQEDAAVADLRRVLAADGQHKVASSLMRQIEEDPVNLYGRESFAYKISTGDSLGTIAQRFMNDRDQFYGLARYNGIAVPRQIAVGQSIRVPGKAPRVVPREATPAPAAATPAPTPTAPPPVATPAAAPAVEAVSDGAKQEQARQAEVARLTKSARSSMARQDLCGAIASWNQVLKLDPNNQTAALERDRALELKKRLPSAKC